jgi:alkylation response protein AidB-like acyl-CoA dehydrogenase
MYGGVARAARDWTLGFLRRRAPTSLGAPLASLPRVQEAVGAIEERRLAAERLLASAAAAVDAGQPPPGREANLLKVTLAEHAVAIVEQCAALAGNHALARRNPLERHWRDVLCARIHTPQADAARLAAGRAALEGD